MNEDLDFKEAPKDYDVELKHYHDVLALAAKRGIIVHGVIVKPGAYRLQTNAPLPDDMRHLVVPE